MLNNNVHQSKMQSAAHHYILQAHQALGEGVHIPTVGITATMMMHRYLAIGFPLLPPTLVR